MQRATATMLQRPAMAFPEPLEALRGHAPYESLFCVIETTGGDGDDDGLMESSTGMPRKGRVRRAWCADGWEDGRWSKGDGADGCDWSVGGGRPRALTTHKVHHPPLPSISHALPPSPLLPHHQHTSLQTFAPSQPPSSTTSGVSQEPLGHPHDHSPLSSPLLPSLPSHTLPPSPLPHPLAMSSRSTHHSSSPHAAALRSLDRNSRLDMWSPYRPERHPLAPPDSPVKTVQLKRRNGRLSYAVTYQKPGYDDRPQAMDDACRAVSRCDVDDARLLRTQQWLDGVEPSHDALSSGGPVRAVERAKRCTSPPRTPDAPDWTVPASEGIAVEDQRSRRSARLCCESLAAVPDLSTAWPVLPPVPSPPPTPWLAPLSTPDLSPLPVHEGFCPCDDDGAQAEIAWQTETQVRVDAQGTGPRTMMCQS